jgi:hypothetical protein
LKRIEELHQKRVNPGYLGVKAPNANVIIDTIREGIQRDGRKRKDAYNRERAHEKCLEKEALKKKMSVPVMLYRKHGIKHPDDFMDEKEQIEKYKKKMFRKRESFYHLCDRNTPSYKPSSHPKGISMRDYIGKNLFPKLRQSLSTTKNLKRIWSSCAIVKRTASSTARTRAQTRTQTPSTNTKFNQRKTRVQSAFGKK